jgi:hypothetical protein
VISKIKKHVKALSNIDDDKVLTGNIASKLLRNLPITNIQDAEFKVFSQWGDDGIIQYLIQNMDIKNKTFVEFGVENYTESNTKFLLMNNNWSGLIIDGSKEHMDFVRSSNLFWKYDLQVVDKFITKDNINEIIKSAGFHEEVGILSVDIDGNDYWVWDAIDCIKPAIVISEYNSVFGLDNPWTVPYDSSFYRTKAHFSNLYYGVSITSLYSLAEKKGYKFVGTNSNGNNAYFVRNDKVNNLRVVDKKAGFTLSKFKESRDKAGNLTYLRGDDRLRLLEGLKIYNTNTNKVETIHI